jgi:hypothetical protein
MSEKTGQQRAKRRKEGFEIMRLALLIALAALAGLSVPARPEAGDIVQLRWGQSSVIEMAFTAENYGEFTKCMDRPGAINCVTALVNSGRIKLLPRGTRAKLLGYQENPYHAKLLTGELVQVHILNAGEFRDKSMWTLENRVTR